MKKFTEVKKVKNICKKQWAYTNVEKYMIHKIREVVCIDIWGP